MRALIIGSGSPACPLPFGSRVGHHVSSSPPQKIRRPIGPVANRGHPRSLGWVRIDPTHRGHDDRWVCLNDRSVVEGVVREASASRLAISSNLAPNSTGPMMARMTSLGRVVTRTTESSTRRT